MKAQWQLTLAALVLSGCASSMESGLRRDLKVHLPAYRAPTSSDAGEVVEIDGSLQSYVAEALRHAPEARAKFERWQAATLSISMARRLPEPNLTYSFFVRRVETRTGPQRHRFGLSQSFPWPTKLTAGADAASNRARAAQYAFDAELLAIRYRVAHAYWTLWLIEREHQLKSEHDKVLEALVETVRARVQTGTANLAELSQIELNLARHHDHHGQHREALSAARAKLRRALGQSSKTEIEFSATDRPADGLPRQTNVELLAMLSEHPTVSQYASLTQASLDIARAEGADRYPRFQIGIDVIETGEAEADVLGSGNDPVLISAGMSLPLWWGSYADTVEAAEARAHAYEADQQVTLRALESKLEATLSGVRDAQRRIRLFRNTLIPQARTTYRSVLGGYRTGRSTVAETLLAQRDLLELQIDLAKAEADHETYYAKLEQVVGTHVPRKGGKQNEQNE